MRNHQVTGKHIYISLYNSRSILSHMISFVPHNNADILVGQTVYSASSKVKAEWKYLTDSYMNTHLLVADPGPRPKFSDSNYKLLSITCALVRRLKAYIS